MGNLHCTSPRDAKLAANLAKLSGEKLPQNVATLNIVVGKLIDEQISTLNG